MHPTAALLLWGLALLVTAGCEVPGELPHLSPAQTALQPGDLPAELQRCPASGAVDGYLREIAPRSPRAHDELQAAWRDLRRQGAAEAALAVYAAQPASCQAPAAGGEGVSVTSLVARFRDEAAAVAAQQRGLLGFATPAEDEEVQGLTRGPATGLGSRSWLLQRTVQRRALVVAYWQRGSVTCFFLSADLDPLHARQALNRIDERMR